MTGGTVVMRTQLRPGDLGMIIHLHGVHYAREHGLDTTFEPYVARPLSEFVLAGSGAGRIWMADAGGHMVGCIAVVRDGDSGQAQLLGQAQLRWFLVTPDQRGTGTGRRLLDEALEYCRADAIAHLHLWTFDDLHAAIHLYLANGFVETERRTHVIWGRERTELRMDLMLTP